jgi:hypothetical protein
LWQYFDGLQKADEFSLPPKGADRITTGPRYTRRSSRALFSSRGTGSLVVAHAQTATMRRVDPGLGTMSTLARRPVERIPLDVTGAWWDGTPRRP